MRLCAKIILCGLIVPVALSAKPAEDSPSRLAAVIRSALIPGWGQFHQNRSVAGFSYSGLFFGGAIATWSLEKNYQLANKHYNSISNPYTTGGLVAGVFGANVTPSSSELMVPLTSFLYNRSFAVRRNNLENKSRQLSNSYSFLGIVYTLNLLDAFFLYEAPGSGSARGSNDKLGAAWRSAVLPGWGQYYQGRKGATYLYGAGMLTLFASVASQTKELERRRSTYSEAAENLLLTSPNSLTAISNNTISQSSATMISIPYLIGSQEAARKVQKAEKHLNYTIYAIGALYFWNIGEVFLFEASDQSRVSLSLQADGARIQTTIRF